jgi:hypothetical protein
LALHAEDNRRSSSRLYFFINIVYDPSQTPMKPTVLRPANVSHVYGTSWLKSHHRCDKVVQRRHPDPESCKALGR